MRLVYRYQYVLLYGLSKGYIQTYTDLKLKSASYPNILYLMLKSCIEFDRKQNALSELSRQTPLGQWIMSVC